jgi:hypothetical protein
MVKIGLETALKYGWSKRTDCLERIFEESLNTYDFEKFQELDSLVKGNF